MYFIYNLYYFYYFNNLYYLYNHIAKNSKRIYIAGGKYMFLG